MNRITLSVVLSVAVALVAAQAYGKDCPLFPKKAEPVACDVKILKNGPQEVLVGQEFAYSLRATNMSKTGYSSVIVTEALPENFTLSGTAPRAELRGRDLVWEIDNLAAGDHRDFVIKGTATHTAKLAGCTTVTCKAPEVCVGFNAVQPELALLLRGPAEAIQCDALKYTLVVTNRGSGTATDVKVSQELPEGLRTFDGKGSFAGDIGSLGPNESREVSFMAHAEHRGEFRTAASASGANGLHAASEPVTTTIRKPALVVTKDAPEMRYVGRPVEYTITVRNEGDAVAKNTVLDEKLMCNPKFIKASDDGKFEKGTIHWDLGSIEPCQERTVKAWIYSDEKGDIRMEAVATSYCGEGATCGVTTIKGVAGILLEMVDLADPIEIGAEETYRITVTNQGSETLTNLAIRAEVPPEQMYVRSSGPTAAEAKDNWVKFAAVPSLEGGKKVIFDVVTKALKDGDTRFKVALTGDQLASPVSKTESTHLYH
jgi:uncharacterized repeat protein (TIGR01451 family)